MAGQSSLRVRLKSLTAAETLAYSSHPSRVVAAGATSHLLAALAVWRMWVTWIPALPISSLVHLVHATTVLAWGYLSTSGGGISDGWEMRTGAWRIGRAGRRLGWITSLTVRPWAPAGGRPLTVILGFTGVVFLLLAGLPFLPDLFEFYIYSKSA